MGPEAQESIMEEGFNNSSFWQSPGWVCSWRRGKRSEPEVTSG